MSDRTVLAWHVLADSGVLGYGDQRPVVPGQTLSAEVVPRLWQGGLHASERLLDALRYASGSKICRVAVWGSLDRAADKLCGRHRHTFWIHDSEDVLWEWLCDEAERRLRDEAAAGWPVDPRTSAALAARRDAAIDRSAVAEAARQAAVEVGRAAAWEVFRLVDATSAWQAARALALAIPTTAAQRRDREEANARLERLVIDRARDGDRW